MKFKTGEIWMTDNISIRAAMDENFVKFLEKSINRHVNGDWGDYRGYEETNEKAIKNNHRITSHYKYGDEEIYIYTEWDRTVTMILFSYEYH